MKNISNMYIKMIFLFCFLLSNIAIAGTDGGTGLPWESAVEKVKTSLLFLGSLLFVIGIIWSGVAFFFQNEKEVGFKRLIGTIIGGSIVFGAKAIVNILFGATF